MKDGQESEQLRIPFVRRISAIAGRDRDRVLAVDNTTGTICQLDLASGHHLGVVNFRDHRAFTGVQALLAEGSRITCAAGNRLRTVSVVDGRVEAESEVTLAELGEITGLTRVGGRLWVADRSGQVRPCEPDGRLSAGWQSSSTVDSMTSHTTGRDEWIFLLDSGSCAVRVHEESGAYLFAITLPYDGATGLVSVPVSWQAQPLLLVSYVQPGWEVFDPGGQVAQSEGMSHLELDREVVNTFVEPLRFSVASLPRGSTVCMSNGYRVELLFANRWAPVPEVEDLLGAAPLKLRQSVPVTTERQRVVSISAFGGLEGELGVDASRQAVIDFPLDGFQRGHHRQVFGYRAVVDVFGIRYRVARVEFQDHLPEDAHSCLATVEAYDMHRPELHAVAGEILQSLPEHERLDMLAVVRAVRSFVYRRLEYRYNRRDTSPVQTLADGEGTCGKYTELLLGLLRLVGVPCRAVGDYKVPSHKLVWGVAGARCRPDADHVWLEVFLPGIGWVPMESSADDLPGRHDRYLAALPWTHIESSRTRHSRELVTVGAEETEHPELSYGDLFEKEVHMRVLSHLDPPEITPEPQL